MSDEPQNETEDSEVVPRPKQTPERIKEMSDFWEYYEGLAQKKEHVKEDSDAASAKQS